MSKAGLVIRNNEEKMAVECVTKAHKWFNEKFNLQTNLTFSREVNWGKDAIHAGYYANQNKEVRINIRNLYGHSIKTILEVLGHEIRHAIQYDNNWIETSRSSKHSSSGYESGKWKGNVYWGKYLTAPWEIDARKYEKQYAKMVIKELGLDEESKIKLPYGTMSVKLKEETQQKFLSKNKNKDIRLFQSYDSKRKSNSNGFCWLDLKQTNYTEWTKQNLSNAFNDYYDLMQSQYVPYETKEEKVGGIDLKSMIF
jgi:hypothetical protein